MIAIALPLVLVLLLVMLMMDVIALKIGLIIIMAAIVLAMIIGGCENDCAYDGNNIDTRDENENCDEYHSDAGGVDDYDGGDNDTHAIDADND